MEASLDNSERGFRVVDPHREKPTPDNMVKTETDARLIDSARELLAVLQDIVTYVSPGDDVPLAVMLDDARAAIAKATGGVESNA